MSYPKSAKPALIIGSVAIDRVATPHQESDNILGGAAAYAAIASSYFAPTRLLGAVGADFPKPFMNRLKRHHIDLEGLKVDPNGKTFFWHGKYRENFEGRDTLEIQLNVFEAFTPELPAHYRSSPYVMLGAIQPSLQNHVIDQLPKGKARPFILADTFDLWIHNTRNELDRMLTRIDLLVINEEESLLLTGERNPILAGPKLRKLGPKIVVIKKGGNGSLLFHPEGFFSIPAYPVTKFIDPTGAGDSYAGALIGYVASKAKTDLATLRQAVAYATSVASLTVESFSVDRLSAGGRTTIDQRFKQLQANSRF